MLVAVPLWVVGGIAQPEVGAEVDDDRRLLPELGHLAHGNAVRQGSEEDIGSVVSRSSDENLRSVRLRRFGWTERTNLPALRSDVTCWIVTSGWSSRRRTSSPPA